MKGKGEIAGIKKRQAIILSVVFSLFILTAGFTYYRYEENRIRNEKYNELKAIAGLKINQIVQWHRDRAADASAASRSLLFIRAVQEFLQNKNNKIISEEIISRLKLINDEFGYENILLADTSGQILLKVASESAHLDSFTNNKSDEAEKQQKITFTDFYFCSFNKEIHYDIIAPIIDKNKHTIAVLVMRRDPHAYLFPLIQTWPTPNKTAETLLLRKEKENILFLNELRHRKNTALKLKIPLTKREVPAVNAALGNTGIFNGRDYNGVKVLSYVSNVPGTPWFMVSKVNEAEIFSELNYKAAIVIILSVLSLLSLWGGLAFIYNSKQKNIYKNLWQTQEEARTTLYSIGDGVLITDEKGYIKQLNPIAEQLTGWKEKDAAGKPLDEVFQIIHEETRGMIVNPIHKVLKENVIVELANHALLISKDGTETPIADSGAPIKNENGKLIGTVLVFRDQTNERAKQKHIEESEQRYRGLFENMMEGFAFCKMIYKESEPIDFIYLAVNNKFETLTGLSNVVGKRVTEIIPGIRESDSEIFNIYSRVALTGENKKIEIFVKALNTWFSVSIYSPLKEHFVAVFDVITVRKQTEESLRLSEERLNRAQEIAHLGSWELDLVENKLTWTDEVYRIFGQEPQEFDATYEAFLEAVHPDDREAVNKAYSGSIRDGKDTYEIEHRIIRKLTGEIRYVHEKCEHFRNEMGKITRSVGMVHDITERKNAEQAVIENRTKLEAALNSMTDAVFISDREGNFIDFNDAFATFHKFKNKTECAKTFAEYPDILDVFMDNGQLAPVEMWAVPRALRGEKISNAEYMLRRKDLNETWWGSYSFGPIRDKDGKIIGSVVVGRDITESKKKEEVLRESEERQRLVLEAASLGTWDLDLVNDKALRSFRHDQIWGYTELQPEWGLEIAMNNVIPEDRPGIMEAYERGIKSSLLFHENRVIWPDGSIHWIRAYGRFRYNNEGQPIRVIGIVEDITERKRLEENLRRRVEEVETLMDVAPVAIWVADDPACNVIRGNRTANNFYEAEGEENVSANVSEVRRFYRNGVELKSEELPMQEAASKNIDIHNSEIDVQLPSGSWLYMLGSASPLRDINGNVRGCIGAFIDHTEMKKARLKLEETLNELQRSNKDLEQFAYVASHDLQEPIRMIKSYTELLRRRSFDKMSNDEKEFFEFISDGALRMHELVNALLQYSRLTSRKKEFEIVDCNIILADALKDLRVTIEETNAVIKYGDLPKVKGDKVMLRQLFQNLIQNAIKFKDNRIPEVIINKERKKSCWTISVKDNGIGIPLEYHEKIFIIFQKLHTRDKYPGTGIGLAVCKKIVELHGGEICLDSEVGKGTTFYFTLPV